MNELRYVLAVVVVVGVPPAVAYWYLIHGFVGFWRRIGTPWSVTVLASSLGAALGILAIERRTLVGSDLGASWALALAGALCLAASFALLRRLRERITRRTMTGVPELEGERDPATLVTGGIYGRIRHPRYAQLAVALLGYSLVANYTGSYATVLASLAAVYGIVLLEERELRRRFGRVYDEYCARVPRFLPSRLPTEPVPAILMEENAMENSQITVTMDRIKDFEFHVSFGGAGHLVMDEAAPLGGGRGPSAAMALSAAVGNCLSASALFCLRKSRVEPKALRTIVTASLQRNERGRFRIGGIAVRIELDVAAEDRPKVSRCVDLFEDYCIVAESVRRGIDVRVEVPGFKEATVPDAAAVPEPEVSTSRCCG